MDKDTGEKIIKARVVVNLKELNSNTHEYLGNTKTLEQIHEALRKWRKKNGMDITACFYQFQVAPDSGKYNVVSAPSGFLEFKGVLHGAKNAPKYVQQMIDMIFEEVGSEVMVDDAFSGGADDYSAIEAMFNNLKVCEKYGIKLSPHKMQISMDEIEAVGYLVNEFGLIPLPRNTTKALRTTFENILTKSVFRTWAGMVTFLSLFVRGLAGKLKHLRKLMWKPEEEAKPRKDKTLSARQKKTKIDKLKLRDSEPERTIFSEVQALLTNLPLLHHPDLTADGGVFHMKSYASLYQVGYSLWQRKGDYIVLCKLGSKALSSAQTRWGITEREAWSVVCGVQAYSRILCMKPFMIVGDHKQGYFNS